MTGPRRTVGLSIPTLKSKVLLDTRVFGASRESDARADTFVVAVPLQKGGVRNRASGLGHECRSTAIRRQPQSDLLVPA